MAEVNLCDRQRLSSGGGLCLIVNGIHKHALREGELPEVRAGAADAHDQVT
jgi:hypothetical protein